MEHYIKNLLLLFNVLLLSQCCFAQNSCDFTQSAVEVRNLNDLADVRVMIGSLIEPNKVITSQRWSFDNANKLNLVVDINCHNIFFDLKTSVCSRIKVKEIISLKSEYNTKNPLVILVLEKPVDNIYAKPTRLATANDSIDGTNCTYTSYEYGISLEQYIESEGQYSETKKKCQKASELQKPFDLKNFIDESQTDVTNIIADSSLSIPKNDDDRLFQDFIVGRDKAPSFHYRRLPYFGTFIDYTLVRLGTPLYCSTNGINKEYVQVGAVSSASSAVVHDGSHSSIKSVLLFRYEKTY